LWLAPEQFAVLPISEKFNTYAQTVVDKLKEIDIRGFWMTVMKKLVEKSGMLKLKRSHSC